MLLVNFLQNNPYIINLLIVIPALWTLLRGSGFISVLKVMLIYTALHYSFGFLPTFSEDYQTLFLEQRTSPHLLVNVIALIFLFGCFLKLILDIKNSGRLQVLKSGRLSMLTKLSALLLCGWVFGEIISAFLKDFYYRDVAIQSLFVTLILLFTLYLKSIDIRKWNWQHQKLTRVFSVLVVLMVGLQLFQIYMGRAYVWGYYFRPDALFFNPNNLAFWYFTALVYFTFVYELGTADRNALMMIAVSTIGFFLAGSRSLFLVLIAFFIVNAFLTILIRGKLKNVLTPFLVHFAALVALCTIPHLLSPFVEEGFTMLVLKSTSARYLFFVPVMIKYFTGNEYYLNVLQKNASSFSGPSMSEYLTSSGVHNISGRLSSQSSDNSFIYTLTTQGPVLTLLWYGLISLPILTALSRIIRRKHETSGSMYGKYLTSYMVSVMIVAFVMRVFTLFPIFFYPAIAMAFLLWWLDDEIK